MSLSFRLMIRVPDRCFSAFLALLLRLAGYEARSPPQGGLHFLVLPASLHDVQVNSRLGAARDVGTVAATAHLTAGLARWPGARAYKLCPLTRNEYTSNTRRHNSTHVVIIVSSNFRSFFLLLCALSADRWPL
jgi:hypothetical protein